MQIVEEDLYTDIVEDDTLGMTELYNMIKAQDAIYLNSFDEFSDSEKEILKRLMSV